MGEAPVVALLTDFGHRDPFVGIMKGVMLGINPRLRSVDLTHEIPAHDLVEGAFALFVSYRSFPKRTIFMVVVDPGVGGGREGVCVRTPSYDFVAPDNGLLQWIVEEEERAEVVALRDPRYRLAPMSSTFHGRDLFAPAAAHLSLGVPPGEFGPPLPRERLSPLPIQFNRMAKRTESGVAGHVMAIDRFGNLSTTIRREDLAGAPSTMTIWVRGATVRGLSPCYEAAQVGSRAPAGTTTLRVPGMVARGSGKPVALWNSFGYLEIAIYQESAAARLSAARGDPVEVRFAAT